MKFEPRFSVIVLSFLAVALLSPFSVAAPLGGSTEPIQIEADRMVSQEKDSSVVFLGNVDARQGELLIKSDKMTVFYEQQGKNKGPAAVTSSGQVEKLICLGNVQISQGSWLGTGERMDYYAGDRKVILSGDAKAWQGQNMVTGKTITYYLDEGRSVVESPEKKQSGRVKAVIQPDSRKK